MARGGFAATDPSTKQQKAPLRPPEWLIGYFQQLSPVIQKNGIWIITAHPDYYREDELDLLAILIWVCVDSKIPVYTCQESNLPNGWCPGEAGLPNKLRRGKINR